MSNTSSNIDLAFLIVPSSELAIVSDSFMHNVMEEVCERNDRNIGEFFVNVGYDGAVNARVDGTCEQCNDALGVGYPNICLLLFGLVHHYPALILPSSSQV